MLLFILVAAISSAIGVSLNKFLYTKKSSVNARQVPVVLIFLITLIVPSFYYGLETIAENSIILNQIMLLAFFSGFTMYSTLFGSEFFAKKNKKLPKPNEDEELMTITVKDKKTLGGFILNKKARLGLVSYHRQKVPSDKQILFKGLDEKTEDDLARRVLRELQDEYEKIELNLKATDNALGHITNNDERQVLSNVLQRFIQARSNLEELAFSMDISIDILNGSRGAAHNSIKKSIRKHDLNTQ